jgi:hypothetical protein
MEGMPEPSALALRHELIPLGARAKGIARLGKHGHSGAAQCIESPLVEACWVISESQPLQQVLDHLTGSAEALSVRIGDREPKRIFDGDGELDKIQTHEWLPRRSLG